MSASTAPRVVLACDAFKGSLSSVQVGRALAVGIAARRPDAQVVLVPVADGGEGTLDAVQAAGGFTRVPITVCGPTGQPVRTAFLLRGDTAVVEMADACGLLRLPGGRPEPVRASSRGLGEAIGHALDTGAGQVVLGVGGSASTDGGAGMLTALGARLLDRDGAPLPEGGGHLGSLARVELSGLDPRIAATEVVLASDVTHPLTGPQGAARVFAPQKGADPAQVDLLAGGLERLAEVLGDLTGRDDTRRPGAGAAGGVGYAALAVLGARMRPGIELVLELAGTADLLAGARLVVTGEGRLDRQTLHGKAVAGVAAAAARAQVPVVAVCGSSELDAEQVRALGLAGVHPLSELETDRQVCITDAARLLTRTGRRIATRWL